MFDIAAKRCKKHNKKITRTNEFYNLLCIDIEIQTFYIPFRLSPFFGNSSWKESFVFAY